MHNIGDTVIFRASGRYVAGPETERLLVVAIGGASASNLGEAKSLIFDLEPGQVIDVTVGKGADDAPGGMVRIERLTPP